VATKPFWSRDEIVLKQANAYSSERSQCGLGVRMRTMVELAALLMGLVAAGIFVAHAVDAYHAQ
jgi:hypothetical protein